MTVTPLARLAEMENQARQGGGPERVERQRARGKMTARERLEELLDPHSFFELDAFDPRIATPDVIKAQFDEFFQVTFPEAAER